MNLIDGKKIASEIQEVLKEKIGRFPRKISLAVLLVGEDPGSISYVRMKQKACLEIGIESIVEKLDLHVSEKTLLDRITALNRDPAIDGILVQQPLPEHIDADNICRAIDPSKDVDGFHPINVGKLLLGQEDGFIPCTPLGIQVLCEKSGIDLTGQHVVIVGRSNIVGKPLAALLVQKRKGCNATVTVAHSLTKNLESITRSADILIAAMGRPHFIRGHMVKSGAVVIDVGVNRIQEKKLVGDVDFLSVSSVASRMTPVPGGVGPMTIAMLMQNTYESAHRRG